MCNLKELTAHAIERAGSRADVAKRDLDAASGHLFLKALAHHSGFELTAREAKPVAHASIFQIIADFSKAAGHFAYTVLEAAIDGVFTPAEKRKIQHAARPLKDCMDRVDHVTAR